MGGPNFNPLERQWITNTGNPVVDMIDENHKSRLGGWKGWVGVAMVILHVLANVVYCGVGAYVVTQSAACEQTYRKFHLKRYISYSMVFSSISLLSFCAYSRVTCKETVRARATALLIMHLAFTVWGSLTWRQMDPSCANRNGSLLVLYQHITVLFNGVYFFLLLVHEVHPPKADWTVMPWFGVILVTQLDTRYSEPQNWQMPDELLPHELGPPKKIIAAESQPFHPVQAVDANAAQVSTGQLRSHLQREFEDLRMEVAPNGTHPQQETTKPEAEPMHRRPP